MIKIICESTDSTQDWPNSGSTDPEWATKFFNQRNFFWLFFQSDLVTFLINQISIEKLAKISDLNQFVLWIY